MLLVTDYYERGSLYDYLQITVLDVEAMTRFSKIVTKFFPSSPHPK